MHFKLERIIGVYMNKLTVNELFSGIGSQRKALDRLGIPHEIVGISEVDKDAIISYEAIHGKTRNYGDISKVEKLDYADLWTYSFPCTDVSTSGRQEGLIKGKTRSGLLYEVERLLDTSERNDELPKFLLLENVTGLITKKFKPFFNKWLDYLGLLGYNSYWAVLNGKDFGVPQNRERVFVVSIRRDIDNNTFEFPKGFDSGVRLKDILETNVDECYYLKQELQDKFREQAIDNNEPVVLCPSRQYDEEGNRSVKHTVKNIVPTILASQHKSGDQQPKIYQNSRVRKLTAKECWRLMDFDDEDFDKAKWYSKTEVDELCKANPNYLTKGRQKQLETSGKIERLSKTALYKQAGNSIIVSVLEAIFGNLFGVTTMGKSLPLMNESINNKLIFIKGLDDNNKQGYRVYDTNGIACTLKATGSGLGGGGIGLYLV